MSRRAALVLSFLALLGCERASFVIGDGCDINSDCASPLVCVIDRCRRQCIDSRDCGAGLRCLVDPDAELGGGCQLEHERECVLTSECTTGLVCQNGTCTTNCVENRDCVSGAMCEDGACVEALTELCAYTSDCPPPLVCGIDQLCHLECATDRDCLAPRRCSPVTSLCELPERLPDGGS